MIQIQQLKLRIPHTEEDIKKKAAGLLRISVPQILTFEITKRSLDARKKPILFYVYTVQLSVRRETALLRALKNPNIQLKNPPAPYSITPAETDPLPFRPAVIGMGPAGLFCAYQLARYGYRPVIFERGADVETRRRDVEAFWQGGPLKENSNVQFGEGGAGTFSDGKLNTLIHDASGRHREVLRLLAAFGAPPAILYDSKPHIGTDILSVVVKNIREEICRLGGEVHFHTQVTGFETADAGDGKMLRALKLLDTRTGAQSVFETQTAVLAIGHSARDTFRVLKDAGFSMCAKSFAVGVRMEHAQQFINESQYGKPHAEALPAAAYKLTAKASDGRGVYTFCMCPGGYVVNASSEEGHLAVNGMSYSGRNGHNANSAVIVTVTPEDFGPDDVLAGLEFQRRLERAAYAEGRGCIPVQLFADFQNNTASRGPGSLLPQMKGSYRWANVRKIFPQAVAAALEEGILSFDKKIAGFVQADALLSGVESRTSSPVRIIRDEETLTASVEGVYPCGEGAGYAGGITSAAMDGLKVAETVIKSHAPFDRMGQV